MSVEDMVSQVLPPLGAVIGTGKPLNFMVTNKWRNLAEIERITDLPLLLMASIHVSLHRGRAPLQCLSSLQWLVSSCRPCMCCLVVCFGQLRSYLV